MKKLSILFAALMVCTLSFAAEVTYDFTKNDWNLPTSANKTAATYTNADGYSISFGESSEGHKFNSYQGSAYLMFGKTNATLTFNSLDKKVTSITITGNSGASVSVQWTLSAKSTQIGNAQQGAKETYTFDIPAAQQAADNTYTIKVTSKHNMQITKVVFTYESEDPNAIDKPTFTPADGDFVGSTTVTLAAGEGLDIYYTLDGTEPTTASTKYAEPFALSATTTVKAIAYNATTSKASEVAEKTYTKHELMTCAEVNAAKQSAFVALNKVTVVYVNGGNIYVKDATGYALIYAHDFGLRAGQEVEGLQGTMDIYNNLPEVKPSVALADLTITEGTVPAPELQTTVPTMADINKYVRIENVTVAEAFEFTDADKQSVAQRTLVAKLGEEDITLYNTFKIDYAFEAKDYNIIGFVTCYNTTIQIAVVSAEEVKDEPLTPATWYSQEAISGTLDGKDVKYAITYEITRNADKTLTIKMNLNDEAAAVEGMVPQLFIAGAFAGNFTNGEFTTTATYTDGDVLEMYFYMAYKNGATASAHFNYTVGSSNEKPTAIDAAVVAPKAQKRIINGVLVIEKDGVLYNAQGAKL